MSNCKACEKRGKTWEGSDPTCSFPEGGAFDSDGWNCATANLIRDIVYEGQDLPWWVDYQYCDDQKYACINLSDGPEVADGPLALWVSWYKQRGRTDAMWLLFQDSPPRLPNEADCIAIVNWHTAEAARRKGG